MRIEWTCSRAAASGAFDLRWSKSGGPPVEPPQRAGFGSQLVRRGLSAAGRVAIDYQPGGVVCTVAASLAEVEDG